MSVEESDLKEVESLESDNRSHNSQLSLSARTFDNDVSLKEDDRNNNIKLLLTWLIEKIEILGYPENKWELSIDRSQPQVLLEFISGNGPKTLSILKAPGGITFATTQPGQGLKISNGIVAYFLRPNSTDLTLENIRKEIQYGTVGDKGLSMASLEIMMKGLVEKEVASNVELSSHYHRCMTTLTDAIHVSDGLTILYCPDIDQLEGFTVNDTDSPGASLVLDKDRIQILESIIIHWTRQIKDAVNSHDSSGAARSDESGPLDEIEFWKTRAKDLIGIQKQLESKNSVQIMNILTNAKSNYVGPLQTLSQQIFSKANEANDNLKFLETLREHASALRTIDPTKLLTVLPDLLNRIRLIWSFSSFYNTNECVASLLRKVSNELIIRFREHISIPEMLQGDVDLSLTRLCCAIESCLQWKKIYRKTYTAIKGLKSKYGRVWDIEDGTIFAQLDAFIQRCKDCVDICESQMQFMRKSAITKGKPGPLPFFSGTKSVEIVEGIKGIQLSFEKLNKTLRSLDYSILDIRHSKWHDDYNSFKSSVKDLEVMYINVINLSFESNTSVAEGASLTATFYGLAKRDLIKKCVEKKATEMFNLFVKTIQKIRTELETSRNNPPLRVHEPQFSGSALWSHGLGVLADECYKDLLQIEHILTSKELEDANEIKINFLQIVKDFKNNRYTTWMNNVETKAKDNGLVSRFDKTLLRKLDTSGKKTTIAEIACNFDEDLLSLFTEVNYWEKFHGEFSIPYFVHDICNKRDQTRHDRELVMNLVKSYNDIMRDINPEEKRLFSDVLRKLDRHISQGIQKLTWQSKNLIEVFVRDCIHSCNEMQKVVVEYKDCRVGIEKAYKAMSSLRLLKLEKNQVFESDVFEKKQLEHKKFVGVIYEQEFNKIVGFLKQIFRHFKEGSTEVQREWKSQIAQIDRRVEQSIKTAVKRSLQELSKAINGDSKTDPLTLFSVQLHLQDSSLIYIPSMVNLTNSVNVLAKNIISSVNVVQRIRNQIFDDKPVGTARDTYSSRDTMEASTKVADQSTKEGLAAASSTKTPLSSVKAAGTSTKASDGAAVPTTTTTATTSSTTAAAPIPPVAATAATGTTNATEEKYKKSYFEIISEDQDILRIVVQIMNGMSSTATELQKYLSYWDKYKTLWELDKDSYIKKFAKSNHPLAIFDREISRYRSQQTEITGEVSYQSILFVRVDCNALREALLNHCLVVQNKLTGLLNQNGLEELNNIANVFIKGKTELTTPPTTLEDLSAKIASHKEYKEIFSQIQNRFDPVREIYQTLLKFDVTVKEDELQLLTTIDSSYEDFGFVLNETQTALDKSKALMRRDLESQMENYSLLMNDIKSTSLSELPFSSELTVQEALQNLSYYREKIKTCKDKESTLALGQAIFNIVATEHKDLSALTKDVELLTQIWTIRQEWEGHWNTWKTCQFSDLNVEEMESVVGGTIKKVGRLGKEMKHYKVWEDMKYSIDVFRETIPLIQDLRSKALRQRHWDSLQEKLGLDFDPKSSEFTLNQILKLGFKNHAEFIGELAGNANKELNIEKALDELEIRWASVELDVAPYKDQYYKLKSTEDIAQLLEDDSVALSTMKASKFYHSFKELIDKWEKKLSIISEVVEQILTVQRKWIYLENIFMAGGDIAKQLPMEFNLFIQVNTDFTAIMTALYKDNIAERSCMVDGLLPKIYKMDEGLERIQKSLDQYLETKRMVFPRFYFVSDDDLLEILGQSKDPVAVQKHIKKCFEGIKALKLIPPATAASGGTNKTFEATLMCSPDGEFANFAENVVIEGAVEIWLVQVEKAMRRGIAKLLSIALTTFKTKKEKWVHDTIGQLLITSGAIVWTNDCTKALTAISNGTKGAMKKQKKKQVTYLNKLTEIIRGSLSKVDRNKVVALITMEIHNRDVMEKMIKANCNAVSDFEWLSQLRFIYLKDAVEFGKCEVRQTNSVLEYSYEYQGNNGRLVVTPLTDRCVLTLITAMYLNRGGNPLGPAGTGKTETVKDLGKNLAKYVVVINCSDGMDYKSVGRIFSGLVQSGSWGCFDEFNRIKIEVISVVAMQILSILNAMSAKLPSFSFMGTTIPCNLNCGIFITMNPGYAGRTELPDNLKALMRPVAMMQPDLTMIAEVMLASEGFNEARIMAKKTVTLYSLMIQQLSKQDHYDYGLRNLKAVLNMAGQLKRNDPNMSEESILMRALRDMNLPKFIKDDERLFRLLLGDLFPGLELPVSEYGSLQAAIIVELQKANLQCHDFLIQKIFQFYDSRLTRHCNMLVGDPLGGKSTAWKILAAAQSALCKQGVEGFQAVQPFIINPKSIELDELYGAYDLQTFEWRDGILSTIFKTCSEDEKPTEKWILFDGPIDAMWIESMNSVMDDNKILTLINGDRIPLTNAMSLVFETQDLRVASPATVSRAGMIYIDAAELGWKTYVESWLTNKFNAPGRTPDEESKTLHREFFEKWVTKALKFKEVNCKEPVKISDFHAVMTLCSLYDSIEKSDINFKKETLGSDYNAVAEKVFVFALAWSLGGAVDELGRRTLNSCLTDIDSILPPANTVYDYYVDVTKNEFIAWESKVPVWRYLKGMTFYDMIVPTVDTVRNSYVVDTYVKSKRNVCLVGATGTGKTVLVQSLLRELPSTHSQLQINFSAATTSAAAQDIMEGPMEKRSKDKLGPAGGKALVVFIDDFNMPKKTSRESPFQPPLELIRLWIDYQGWYDRTKCSWKNIVDTQLIVSMGHPGGGRNNISERTQSRFCLLNTTFPADNQIVRIFDTILSSKLSEYENDIKSLSTGIATATLNVYKAVSADFLATPEKFHYLL